MPVGMGVKEKEERSWLWMTRQEGAGVPAVVGHEEEGVFVTV